MIRHFLLLVCVAPYICAAADQSPSAAQLEYKGVRLGATQAELLSAHPEFRCSQDRDYPDDTTCSITPRCQYLSRSGRADCEREFLERHTYAGEPAMMTMASFHRNHLVSIGTQIRPKSYERVRDALATKYGQAEETIETVTTNAGVTHENKLASWRLSDGVIRVRRLSSRVDQGLVTLMSQSYLTLVQERKKAKASTAPSDL